MTEILEDNGVQVERKELVDSFSKHANLSNKYMLGILLVSITFAMNIDPSETFEFPFIGNISVIYYYLILMSLLSCLIVLFSSSHLMALRIREYYNKYFYKANDKDFIDLTVEPTIFRMAPISWMIKNKNIFFINITEGNKKWKKFELFIYFILKAFTFIVSYLFPTVVLIIILIKSKIFDFDISINILLRLLLISLSFISILTFTIVWKNEILFIFRMPQKIIKNNRSAQQTI